MKTVLIVLNTSWNLYNFRLNLMKALKKENYKVIALAPYDKYSLKLKEEGFEWIHLPLNNDSTNPLKELQQIRTFYKIYKKLKPDIILHYTIKPNIYGTFVGKLLGIPSINNVSGLGTIFLKKKLVYKIAQVLYRIIFRFSAKVFFQNKYDYNLFIDNKLIKENIAEVIPGSGIDCQRFKPIKTSRYRDDSIITFLMIARLIKDKGILEYIESIRILKKKYKNIQFKLIGSLYLSNPTAISEELLQSWINESLIEYLPFSDTMEEVISIVDCIVLPSYREGLSRVLLEAASMEKPIITTNVAGCKDVVEDGLNGYLCEVRDEKSLAEKIEKMILLSAIERKKMGEKGREKVLKEFDEKLVIEQYLNSIIELI